MRLQSTFVRVSSAAALLALVATVAFAGSAPQASAQAATMAPTMAAGTMAATMMAAPGAVPPCPTGISLPAATMQGTMAATMSSSIYATMAATMSAPVATMAPTMAMAMPTMAGTAPAMTVVPGMTMNGCELTAKLDGKDEGGGKPGAVNGTGTATLMLSHPANGLGEVCFSWQVSGITLPVVASHIHKGAAGVAGPVVVPFIGSTDGKASGCTENVPAALIDAILANPSGYYVNVHNADFPGGAIRGQLSATAQ